MADWCDRRAGKFYSTKVDYSLILRDRPSIKGPVDVVPFILSERALGRNRRGSEGCVLGTGDGKRARDLVSARFSYLDYIRDRRSTASLQVTRLTAMAAEAHVDCMYGPSHLAVSQTRKQQGRPNEAWKLGELEYKVSLNDLFVTEAFQDLPRICMKLNVCEL